MWQGENAGEYILILCNAIGSPVDSKYIEVGKRRNNSTTKVQWLAFSVYQESVMTC
jgi:hypothetical protein